MDPFQTSMLPEYMTNFSVVAFYSFPAVYKVMQSHVYKVIQIHVFCMCMDKPTLTQQLPHVMLSAPIIEQYETGNKYVLSIADG